MMKCMSLEQHQDRIIRQCIRFSPKLSNTPCTESPLWNRILERIRDPSEKLFDLMYTMHQAGCSTWIQIYPIGTKSILMTTNPTEMNMAHLDAVADTFPSRFRQLSAIKEVYTVLRKMDQDHHTCKLESDIPSWVTNFPRRNQTLYYKVKLLNWIKFNADIVRHTLEYQWICFTLDWGFTPKKILKSRSQGIDVFIALLQPQYIHNMYCRKYKLSADYFKVFNQQAKVIHEYMKQYANVLDPISQERIQKLKVKLVMKPLKKKYRWTHMKTIDDIIRQHKKAFAESENVKRRLNKVYSFMMNAYYDTFENIVYIPLAFIRYILGFPHPEITFSRVVLHEMFHALDERNTKLYTCIYKKPYTTSSLITDTYTLVDHLPLNQRYEVWCDSMAFKYCWQWFNWDVSFEEYVHLFRETECVEPSDSVHLGTIQRADEVLRMYQKL